MGRIYEVIEFSVVEPLPDGWRNTTREPTPDEAEKIIAWLKRYRRRTGYLPVGGGPVPGVGDVVFGLAPQN